MRKLVTTEAGGRLELDTLVAQIQRTLARKACRRLTGAELDPLLRKLVRAVSASEEPPPKARGRTRTRDDARTSASVTAAPPAGSVESRDSELGWSSSSPDGSAPADSEDQRSASHDSPSSGPAERDPALGTSSLEAPLRTGVNNATAGPKESPRERRGGVADSSAAAMTFSAADGPFSSSTASEVLSSIRDRTRADFERSDLSLDVSSDLSRDFDPRGAASVAAEALCRLLLGASPGLTELAESGADMPRAGTLPGRVLEALSGTRASRFACLETADFDDLPELARLSIALGDPPAERDARLLSRLEAEPCARRRASLWPAFAICPALAPASSLSSPTASGLAASSRRAAGIRDSGRARHAPEEDRPPQASSVSGRVEPESESGETRRDPQARPVKPRERSAGPGIDLKLRRRIAGALTEALLSDDRAEALSAAVTLAWRWQHRPPKLVVETLISAFHTLAYLGRGDAERTDRLGSAFASGIETGGSVRGAGGDHVRGPARVASAERPGARELSSRGSGRSIEHQEWRLSATPFPWRSTGLLGLAAVTLGRLEGTGGLPMGSAASTALILAFDHLEPFAAIDAAEAALALLFGPSSAPELGPGSRGLLPSVREQADSRGPPEPSSASRSEDLRGPCSPDCARPRASTAGGEPEPEGSHRAGASEHPRDSIAPSSGTSPPASRRPSIRPPSVPVMRIAGDLTLPQRALLEAIVATPRLWRYHDGLWGLLDPYRLPASQPELARLLE